MTTKTARQIKNATVKAYILNAIDSDGYGETPATETEKLQFLDRTFRAEYEWMIARVGYQKAMAEWISGLPSSFNVEFRNSKIVEIAKTWGDLPANATDDQEWKIISNWFNYIAAKTTMMIKKVTP